MIKSLLKCSAMGLCALPSCASGSNQADKPVRPLPNILCIVCEDTSPYLGCYGDPVAKTPVIDSLARQSVRYTNMYSTVGVSAPSRFSLITGMYPSAMGANYMRTQGHKPEYMPEGVRPYSVVTPPEVKCYSEYMRAAGYYCTNGPKTDYQFAAPLTAWDECGKTPDFLKRPEGMPFFSIINLNVTHESKLWQRGSLPLEVDPADIIVPPYFPDTPTVRHDMAVMYSNIAEMDRQTGELLKKLEESGEMDNTIVIWYSDNGGPIPRGKREIYITGTKVPFMIRYPDGYRAGEVEDRICMFVDIPATIMSLAGLKTPSYMHGRPFAGPYEAAPRSYAYCARDRMDEKVDKQGGITDGRWQYIRNYIPERSDFLNTAFQNTLPALQKMIGMYERGELNEDQAKWFKPNRPEEEFYDLESDPYELHNLASEMKDSPQMKKLRREYDKWIKKYNKAWFIPEIDSYNSFCPGGVKQVTAVPTFSVKNGLVSLKCETAGSSIAYRVFRSGGRKGRWLLYTGPFAIPDGQVAEAVGVRIGFADSEPLLVELVED